MLAFQREEIGDLTKDMMMERADELKKSLPKKGKNGKAEPTAEETPRADTPTETTPTDTPPTVSPATEEKKKE